MCFCRKLPCQKHKLLCSQLPLKHSGMLFHDHLYHPLSLKCYEALTNIRTRDLLFTQALASVNNLLVKQTGGRFLCPTNSILSYEELLTTSPFATVSTHTQKYTVTTYKNTCPKRAVIFQVSFFPLSPRRAIKLSTLRGYGIPDFIRSFRSLWS